MSLRRRGRATARRVALGGLWTAYRLSGAARAAAAQPGVTVLLLHNTPPPLLARLTGFIDRRPGLVVDFATAIRSLEDGTVDRPMVALTFDDGFRSNLDAARELTARGIGACFYVPTGVVGMGRAEADAFFRRPQAEGVMTWEELERLRDSGHVVGSHCRQHLPLAEMSPAEAEDQVKGSVATLRERLGPTSYFAWPFGSLRHAPVDLVRQWCDEVAVLPASGVRGRNTPALMGRRGYLSRDAVDLRWIGQDVDVFTSRSHRRIG